MFFQGTVNSYKYAFQLILSNRIRPGWVAGESFSPDLAIVELNRRIEQFVPNMINPICVPTSEAFKDRPKDAYVGGWGAERFRCDTNDFGPNPHTMCKFPFVFKAQHDQITFERNFLLIFLE